MTAVYNGDSDDSGQHLRRSQGHRQGSRQSTAKLAVNDRDFTHGFRPTLTATVSPAGATGTVTFRDGSKVLGTVAVSKGKAVVQGAGPGRGTHRLTATYNGSGVYNPATSAAVSVVVR